MKFFADEGLDYPLVAALREQAHEVIYAAEDFSGKADAILLEEALKQKVLLLTKDKDFGEMVIRQQQTTTGVVLIRIEALNVPANVNLVVSLIRQHEADLYNSFTVIQEDKIRIRKLK